LPEPGPATQARPRPGAVSGARTAPPPQPQPLAEPLKVGHVISVSGARISGILHSGGNASYVDVASAVQLGAMLKMATPKSQVFGIVSGLRTTDPRPQADASEKKIVDIELLGEAITVRDDGAKPFFQRGVSVYPALGEPIVTTSPNELRHIYARPTASNVRVGTLYQDSKLPAYLLTNELLGKHFAVLGTTGAGKSCATTLILRSILTDYPNGHVILLDPHNEYAQAFGDAAEVLSPDNLQLPYWLLDFEEMCEIMVDRGRSDSESQIEILSTAIVSAKKKYQGSGTDTSYITVDTPVPYNLTELIKIIETGMGQLDKPENSLPYLRLKSRLDVLRSDLRYGFMFSGLVVKDEMAQIVSRIMRIPVAGKPITILDLSAVPSEIVDIVVSVMCRLIFDFCLWTQPPQALPVLLVCEEAHRYVPEDNLMGFGPTKKMLSRIAKEGRKYGVSLCLVTQRPAELSTSILSQCNTLFALRMSNDRDQEFVRKALPESSTGLIASLPSLHTQEAVVVGEGVTVPMRLKFDHLEEDDRPRSGNADFSTAWKHDIDPGDAVEQIIERWRYQMR
jgi:DNA helicase HerA-like ATPase